MCLGVPGKVVQVSADGGVMPMGKVSFGGVLREVCFAYVPEAKPGDYVLVHVGFALSVLDEEQAREIFRVLERMAEPTVPPASSDGEGAVEVA